MIRRLLCAAALVLAAGCASANHPRGAAPPEIPSTTVWQVSPFAPLVDGAFRGVVTVEEAGRYGDLGVGAADQLDGEIAVVAGKFYQFLEGGQAVTPDPLLPLPFAIMTQWRGGDVAPIQLRNGQRFDSARLAAIDSLLPTTDAFYALVLTGTWNVVYARTFKCQRPPYRRLTAAAQDTFTITQVKGTMVGYREPRYADSLSVANYHLHFVSSSLADGQRGGHVLSFTAGPDVKLEYAIRPYFNLYMPRVPQAPPPNPCSRRPDGA
jgi:acetolactate decarboxylase